MMHPMPGPGNAGDIIGARSVVTEKGVVVTNPDPTEAVKEALELAIRNLDEKIDRRFRGIDEATILARDEMKDKLSALKETIQDAATAEKAANKDLVEKLEKANQVALTAALSTQKESAAKSELAMADRLNQLQASFETANKLTNDNINRLTSRLDTGEGRIGGVDSNRQEERKQVVDNRSYNAIIIGIGVSIIGLLLGLLFHAGAFK